MSESEPSKLSFTGLALGLVRFRAHLARARFDSSLSQGLIEPKPLNELAQFCCNPIFVQII